MIKAVCREYCCVISEINIAGFIQRRNILELSGAYVVRDLSLRTFCCSVRRCLFSGAV